MPKQKPASRLRKEYRVYEVEFFMGNNSVSAIRDGGPRQFFFSVCTDLPKADIQRVAQDGTLQDEIHCYGGDGSYEILETWSDSYRKTKSGFLNACLKRVREFSVKPAAEDHY